MARGPSGRIVIEVDASLKHNLHAALAAEGMSLKNWFLARVKDYFEEKRQPVLPGFVKRTSMSDSDVKLLAEESPEYRKKQKAS